MVLIQIGEEVKKGFHSIVMVAYEYDPERANGVDIFEVEDMPHIQPHPEKEYVNLVPLFDIEKKEIAMVEFERELNFVEQLDRKLTLATSILETPDFILSDSSRVEAMTVEEAKEVKINQLKEKCTKAIHSGFTSASIEKGFGFNENDQMNFTQQLLIIVASGGVEKYPAKIQWKALSGEVIEIGAVDFVTLIGEAELHKRTNQNKYWALETSVKEAETKEEVLEIIW